VATTCTAPADAPLTHEPVAYFPLLDLEPDFGAGVDPETLAQARRRAVVPLLDVPQGPCDPRALRGGHATGAFAALVVSGLLVRDVGLSGRVAMQLVGPGDVLSLGPAESGLPLVSERWHAASPMTLAVLDERFLAAAQRWPWLTARVVERAARWADRSATLQAIGALGRVDLRILAILWHIAERWGRVTPDGVAVPIALTHETLGRLVAAQRPTVTLALKDLRDRDAVRTRGGTWLLNPASVALVEAEPEASQPATVSVLPGSVARARPSQNGWATTGAREAAVAD
jgi:CRP/FNR family transcriptional regulator, cyclic AMP receptor protein